MSSSLVLLFEHQMNGDLLLWSASRGGTDLLWSKKLAVSPICDPLKTKRSFLPLILFFWWWFWFVSFPRGFLCMYVCVYFPCVWWDPENCKLSAEEKLLRCKLKGLPGCPDEGEEKGFTASQLNCLVLSVPILLLSLNSAQLFSVVQSYSDHEASPRHS